RGDREGMQRALLGAAEAPLEGAAACLEALQLAADALALGNKHLVSDVACANEFANAALAACAHNVRINHKYLKDANAVAAQSQRLQTIENQGEALYRATAASMRPV
ncbi:MAG TPA: cyclodeaminase/cyclohydrolase family protein, partial [Candidatus Baltobacteraceae bacterium]|nr:cyclodeaminase/cyclohydrolase family protein [Candidatus Baltobacteraceae bacterium]